MLRHLVLVAILLASSWASFFELQPSIKKDWRREKEEILELVRLQESRIVKLEEELAALRYEPSPWNGTLPTSCNDLWDMGHLKAGIYPVVVENELRLIYCDYEDFTIVSIGELVVQHGVYFNVHRAGQFDNNNNAITIYYNERITAHPAMDAATGVFTAPVDGTYFFHFHCHTYTAGVFGGSTADRTRIAMLLNSQQVTFNYAYTDYYTERTLAMTATLHLKVGDTVEVRFEYGDIRDPYFGGSLLEPDTTFSLLG